MFSNAKSLLVVLAASLVAVQAQSDTTSAAGSTASLSACLLQCVTQAASSAGCSSYTDLQCVCTSSTFQTDATDCLTASCSAQDLATALALQQEECAAIVGTSGTPTSTGTPTGSATGTSAAATTTGTSAAATTTGTSAAGTTTGSTTSTSPAKTATTTTTTSTSAATTSSSAAVGLVPFPFGGVFGTLVASVGALVGAALVL